MQKKPSYEEWVQRMHESQKVRALLERAIQYHQLEQLAKAQAMYKQILEINPNHPDSLHLLGLIEHQTGNNEEAVNYINMAVHNDPGNPIYHNNLGTALKTSGSREKSLSHFEKAISLKPDFPEPYNNAGVVHEEWGKLAEASSYFEKAVQLKPDFGEALSNWLHLLLQTCAWQELDNLNRTWETSKEWTEFMVGSRISRAQEDYGVLGRIGTYLGYQLQSEYLRVDQIWYFSPPNDESDWDIDAFLEHENDPRRLKETVRKLLQLGPGLKVVITYPDQNRVDESVNSVANLIETRFGTPTDTRFLLVFGSLQEDSIHWIGYEFDGLGRTCQLCG